MADVAIQQLTVAGVTPTFAAASGGGDALVGVSDDRCFLRVKNGNASPQNVIFTPPGTVYGQSIPVRTIAVPATTGDILISVPVGYTDPTTGKILVTYSGVASLTVALVRA